MATGVQSWSKTAASNATADSNVNWAEGQAPSSVNDSARAEMASVAKWRDDISGTVTTGGSSTAYTMTSNQGFASAAAMSGAMLTFIPHTTSGASPTLAVDGLTARQIRSATGSNVATGALIAGTPYQVTYIHASTEFILVGYTEVFGNATVTGTLGVTGVATFTAAPVFNGGASLNTGTYSGNATFSGNLVLSGTPNYTNTTKAMGIAGGTTGQRNGSPTEGDTRYNTTLHCLEFYDGTRWATFLARTTQYLPSGSSATYTTPAGCRSIIVKMIGGGGGGGATATNAGSTGSTTTFNSITAVGGSGGAAGSTVGRTGGAGGTGGTGSAVRLPGSTGSNGSSDGNSGGGTGAPGLFGTGAGQGGPVGGTAPGAGGANTGAGGGGASSAAQGGGGGGAGEYVEIGISNPATTYTYTVGGGGAGGTAGTTAGGAGGSGFIIVEEYY